MPTLIHPNKPVDASALIETLVERHGEQFRKVIADSVTWVISKLPEWGTTGFDLDAYVQAIVDSVSLPHGEHPDYVSVTHGMSGYFAVHLRWYNEFSGYYDVEQSGHGRYSTKEEAEAEGREWAKAMGVEFRP